MARCAARAVVSKASCPAGATRYADGRIDATTVLLMSDDRATLVGECLARLRRGDAGARDELLGAAGRRLLDLTRSMPKGYRRLRRWEETDDVVQGALLRLHRALAAVA